MNLGKYHLSLSNLILNQYLRVNQNLRVNKKYN